MSHDIKIILEKKNLILLENLIFTGEKEKLYFLNKLEEIEKNKIELKFLNNDIKEIILKIELNDENLKKLRKFNWEDLLEITRDFHSKKQNERQKRIYLNFINFIKSELNLMQVEKPLVEKSLINKTNKKTKNTKKSKNINSNQETQKLDQSIFKKRENFNVEQDTLEKAKKYGVNILFDYKGEGKKNTVNDFVLYFTKRLKYFTELLQNRVNADNVMRISKLKDLFETNEVVTVIGLISEFKYTKNGHLMLTIEDRGGEIKCFINKNKIDKKGDKYSPELAKIVGNLCLDEGIGIVGKIGNNIIWTDDIIIPSPPNSSELKKTQETEYVVCISDLHFGAKVFVDEAFQKFIDWLNGRTGSDQLNSIAKKVKYIMIPGDLIEGIGIYPGQGEDARILSSELQYHEAARLLDQIPKDKCIIMIPGNHDTMRLSEPQLKLPYEKAYALHNMENVINLSNPSIVKLFGDDPECFGLDFYMYHGGSIFYYADKIQYLREKGGGKAPEEVIKYLLEKRHLAPSHGSTLYVPDSQTDPLVIKKMPDFFLTGHTHKMSLANYKGCTICSCGCWVEMSDYQEKMGMYPDVGKAILINTRTRKPQILNFNKDK